MEGFARSSSSSSRLQAPRRNDEPTTPHMRSSGSLGAMSRTQPGGAGSRRPSTLPRTEVQEDSLPALDDGIRHAHDGARFFVGPRLQAPTGLPRHQALFFLQEMEDKKAVLHYETFENAAKVMREYPDDLELQTKACFAMAYNALTNSRRVLKVGGLELVLAAMKRFPTSEKLQQEACECLRYLTARGDDTRTVLRGGGLDALFMALRNCDKGIHVQQEALGALKNISTREAALVLRSGGLEQVMKVMDLCPRNSWVQLWGCQALQKLAEHDSRRVEEAGGFRRVAASMKRHEKVEVVQWAGAEALKLKPVAQR